jgi:SH3 domain-containing YSC84-like protein 1
MRTTLAAILTMACALSTNALADKEARVNDRIDASTDLMTAMTRADDKGVPQDLLDKARCIVLVPGMKKGGFIVGAKYGRGFAFCRRTSGAGWTAPAAIRVEGGSVGFQIGGSEQDILLLVMNEDGMKHMLTSKFTLGPDATVSAGPVGRDASAQTDAKMRAEILSYSRSRGLFAGISLEGATLRPDDETNRELYGKEMNNKEILTGDVKTPAVAEKLEQTLNHNSMSRTK